MVETQEQNTNDTEARKYMIAFDRLVGLIQNKGKITPQDIENDSILKDALRDQAGVEAMKFLFQHTNDFIMDETKKLVNDPRKKIQELAKKALTIAEKMVNCGEVWSHVQRLILDSDLMRGLRQLGLA